MPIARFDRGDAGNLLDKLKSSDAFKESRFSSKVYEDEPILRTGRQLQHKQEHKSLLDELHALSGSPELRYAPTAEVFYRQALLVAQRSATGPCNVRFASYYPSYQVMTSRQLDAYVSWRTSLLEGCLRKAPVGFAFMYIYELLMGVGATPGEEGFQALVSFWERWRGGFDEADDFEEPVGGPRETPRALYDWHDTMMVSEPRSPRDEDEERGFLDDYMPSWLRDYVVYHGLDQDFLERIPEEAVSGRTRDLPLKAVLLLKSAQERVLSGGTFSDDEVPPLFDAICSTSSFNLSTSKFYKDNPEDTQAVTVAVFSRMVEHCGKRRKTGFVEGLFGTGYNTRYAMFSRAVFHEAVPHADAEYSLDTGEVFTCKDGRWSYVSPCSETTRNKELGRILHVVDSNMRKQFGYPKMVKEYAVPKYVHGYVSKEVALRLAWKEAHTVAPIKLDRKMLKGIRASAAKTREALLVDEEREEYETPPVLATRVEPHPVLTEPLEMLSEIPAASVVQESVQSGENRGASLPCGLTKQEFDLVRALLVDDRTAVKVALGRGMVSLVVDSVNEKLLNQLGDTALEFAGDEPELVEDYREDIAALLGV